MQTDFCLEPNSFLWSISKKEEDRAEIVRIYRVSPKTVGFVFKIWI